MIGLFIFGIAFLIATLCCKTKGIWFYFIGPGSRVNIDRGEDIMRAKAKFTSG